MNASDHLKKSMHIKIIQQTFGKKKDVLFKDSLAGNWKELETTVTVYYSSLRIVDNCT